MFGYNPLGEFFVDFASEPKIKVNFMSHRKAVVDCPTCESEVDDQLTAEQRQRILESKHQNIREIICE